MNDTSTRVDVEDAADELEEHFWATRVFALLCLSASVVTVYLAMFGERSGVSNGGQTYWIATFVLAAIGLVAYVGRNSLGTTRLSSLCACGILAITLGISWDGINGLALPFLFVWISVFAWYFLPIEHAIGLNGGIVFGYLAVLGQRVSAERYPVFAMTLLGSIVMAGIVFGIGRRRISFVLEKLVQLAETDPLTSLANRRRFQVFMNDTIARVSRYDGIFSVVMIDIDHFKSINDTHGHDKGDQVLKSIAAIVSEGVRETDLAARLGGEEFAAILVETDISGAAIVAERLRLGVEAAQHGIPETVTISIGIAQYATHGVDGDVLLSSADKALYIAKESGRNRIVAYEETISKVAAVSRGITEKETRTNLEVLMRIARLAEPDPASHERMHVIGMIASATASMLGVPDDIAQDVRIAGALHDIGKIGLSSTLLNKAGPVSDEELDQLRSYPNIGAEIMGRFGYTEIASWVARMHERPVGEFSDGNNEDIPLVVKILAVVDAFDAMTAHRPYRRGRSVASALAELKANVGVQFDANVVEKFFDAIAMLTPDDVAQLETAREFAPVVI